ncbi:MAG: LysE family translocator [Actinomycetota bacterium]
MPPVADLVAFAAFSLVIVVIPGPAIAFIVGRGVALGRRPALDTVLGNTLGAAIQVTLVAAGLVPLLERSDRTYDIIRLAGAAYLVVLGVRALRSTDRLVVDADQRHAARRQHIREGFVVGITNPKLAILLAATLPQFMDGATTGTLVPYAVSFATVFALVALVADSLWAVLAGAARDWFGRSEDRLRQLRAGGGAVMIGVGIYAVFS